MKVRDRCAVCGLHLLPDQGDLFGSLMFFDRMLFIIPLIVLFYFRLWHPSLPVFLIFGGLLLFTMIYTTPHRNGISLAIDYFIRRKSGDLAEDAESEDR